MPPDHTDLWDVLDERDSQLDVGEVEDKVQPGDDRAFRSPCDDESKQSKQPHGY